MIIGSFIPYKVGTIEHGIYTRKPGEQYSIAVFILRESNKDEWIKYRQEEGLPIIPYQQIAYFYKVSMD